MEYAERAFCFLHDLEILHSKSDLEAYLKSMEFEHTQVTKIFLTPCSNSQHDCDMDCLNEPSSLKQIVVSNEQNEYMNNFSCDTNAWTTPIIATDG